MQEKVSAAGRVGRVDDFRMIEATAGIHRTRTPGFPAFEVKADGRRVAAIGRYSALNIFFGWGQRIRLADGSRWRLRTMGTAANIRPTIVNSEGQRVAQASQRIGTYGITGKEWGYVLLPNEATKLVRPQHWTLAQLDDHVAQLTRRPRRVITSEPVPLAAILLAFALIDLGIVGEDRPRIPAFKWA